MSGGGGGGGGSDLSHLDAQGRASMVDVSGKPETLREATARGLVSLSRATLEHVREHGVAKGDLLGVARIAGIMAAKQTHLLIPLCHALPLDEVAVRFAWLEADGGHAHSDLPALLIEATARTRASTGVEMEALTAVQVAALTVYDMLKAVDRGLRIGHVHLVSKRGGRSGLFVSGYHLPGVEPTEWL